MTKIQFYSADPARAKAIKPLLLLADYLASAESPHSEAYHMIVEAEAQNPWFCIPFLQFACIEASLKLGRENLLRWAEKYPIDKPSSPKRIGMITAGNIPMVWLHDLVAVLLTGHHLTVKTASRDKVLFPALVQFLEKADPEIKGRITFSEKLGPCDAFIGTGSNLSAKYFTESFGHLPLILRKTRGSLVYLTGTEQDEQFELLAEDCLMYFGLGCRNTGLIFLPKGYDVEKLSKNFARFQWITTHPSYNHNYRYQKAIAEINQEPYFDFGCVLLKETRHLFPPIAVIYYSFYENRQEVDEYIASNYDKIQCISAAKDSHSCIEIGKCQRPDLSDYADGVDTLEFLISLG